MSEEQEQPKEFLFEKVFFMAAHIAILEEALATAKADFTMLSAEHHLDLSAELGKIAVAYSSIEKLKKGAK